MKKSKRPKRKEQLTGGATATATATATVANGQVTAVTVTNGGSGYTSVPTVSLQGGAGIGARVQAVVSNGVVTAVKVVNGGRNYQSAPTVNISMDGGPSLLTYAILTNPDPLEVPQNASQFSQLTLSVTNPGSNTVYCSSIAVTMPGPSQNAQDLTNSFTGIGVVVPVDNNGKPLWDVSQNGGIFTLTPLTASAGQIGAQGLVFIFDNILVNNSPGTCLVSIAEIASTSTQPSGIRSFTPIALNKWPALFSMTGPTAKPLEVDYGGSTQIMWSVIGSQVTCELLFDPDGQGHHPPVPVPNIGPYTAANLTNPNGVVFTLQVTLNVPGQSTPMILQQQVYVGVIPNPTITLTIAANPITPGKPLTFTLNWTVVDVTSFQVTANDGPNGNTYTLPVPFSPTGSYVVTPHRLNTSYVMQVIATDSRFED